MPYLEQIHQLESIGMEWNTHDARWEMYFCAAERYYHEHGNLLVPRKYETKDGLKLGVWIFNQRSKRKNIIKGQLSDEQIQRLDSIGMVWDNILDQQWMQYYAAARDYFEHNGNLRISKRYETDDGLKLGIWVVNQRQLYQKNKNKKEKMSSERIRLLNKIGMLWKTSS